jgi:hypothetical protein
VNLHDQICPSNFLQTSPVHLSKTLYTLYLNQLPMQSMPITTKVTSSNFAHGEVYSMQHYVIKFVSDLRQVGGFSPGTLVSSTIKTDCHTIIKMIL